MAHRPDLVDSYAGLALVRQHYLSKSTVLSFTDEVFVALGEAKVAESVLLKLKLMNGKELTRGEWERELAKALSPDELKQWKDVILQHAKKSSSADDAIVEMLKMNEANFRAHLIAANYWRKSGRLENAEPEISKARQLAPNELEVLLSSADLARSRSRSLTREGKKELAEASIAECSRFLSCALEQHPKATAVYPQWQTSKPKRGNCPMPCS